MAHCPRVRYKKGSAFRIRDAGDKTLFGNPIQIRSMSASPSASNRRSGRTGPLLCALALGLTLGACSMFSGDDDSAAKPPPGDDKKFPSLAEVPEKKPDASDEDQRMRIQEGLLADRKNARHVDGPAPGVEELAEQPTGARTVKPVVIDPGEARVAARQQRQPAKIDGVSIVQSGLVTAVSFPKGSTALPGGSGRTIVRIAQLQGATKGKLTVIGRGANKAEGLARAQAIANGLINLGVSGGDIRVSGAQSSKSQVEVYISGGRAPKRN